MQIAATARILERVVLDVTCRVEDFVVVGAWGGEGERPETHIGPGGLLRTHTVIYSGNKIGARFQTGHGVLIREMNEIGDDVSIGSHSVVEHHVRIGHEVRLHSNVFVPEFCVLEDEAWLGPNVCLTNADHPKCPNIPQCLRGVTVERGAKIGANATLLPGVRVGAFALVGAGAVVVGNVPPRAVVVGNPARVIKMIDDLVCMSDLLTRPYADATR